MIYRIFIYILCSYRLIENFGKKQTNLILWNYIYLFIYISMQLFIRHAYAVLYARKHACTHLLFSNHHHSRHALDIVYIDSACIPTCGRIYVSMYIYAYICKRKERRKAEWPKTFTHAYTHIHTHAHPHRNQRSWIIHAFTLIHGQ